MTQEERAALVEALRNTGLQSAAIAADQIEADGETIALQKTTIQNLIDAGDGLCKRIAELEAELAEQCRLHGMGSEREAKQLSQIKRDAKRIAELEATVKALVEALGEAKLQLEYLDERFPTGTTPAVLTRIDEALALVGGKA